MDKREELKYSKFFIDRLNKRCGLDYSVQLNKNENKVDPEVDVYVISGSNLQFNIQVRTREGRLKKIKAALQRESKIKNQNVVMGPVMDWKTKEWVVEAIREKEGHYSTDVKQKLVLLITGDIGPLFNEDYAKRIFEELKDSEFKGIYSIHLPATPESSSHPHDGQIIAIKDIFGKHGISF